MAGIAVGVGCGDNLRPPPPPPDALLGGAIAVPGCGYRLVTRAGTEEPRLPGDRVGDGPAPMQVHLGLAGDARSSMVVVWRTEDDATTVGEVRFGVGDVLDRTAPGLTYAYLTDFGNGVPVRIHEAHLCGLRPDTAYRYVVESAGRRSPTYQFRTAPDLEVTPDAEVTIAAVGDSRGGYDVWSQVADQLIARAPDVVIFSGDAVTLGPSQGEWDEFFTAGESLLSQVPVLAVHGNHELNAPNYYAQFALPGDEENYSLDYGAAHLTVLNDTPQFQDDLTGRTAAFLRADLTAHADAPWRIVNHHRPMYSAAFHGGDATLRDAWEPILDAGRVQLVLTGHEHAYERTHPMRAGVPQASPADGTIHVVSGGAGAPLYTAGTGAWTAVSASLHSATISRVRRTALAFTAFDQLGASVDAFTLVAP